MPETKPEEQTFVNVLMPKTMAEQLETLATQYDTDRSKLVRNLIRKEWKLFKRRQETLATSKQLIHN
jgi:metal-responsive CopG/Arc/MetJ family transcriptional regulator